MCDKLVPPNNPQCTFIHVVARKIQNPFANKFDFHFLVSFLCHLKIVANFLPPCKFFTQTMTAKPVACQVLWCSSEKASLYPAANIINWKDHMSVWQTDGDQKEAKILLTLSKSCKIHAITMGNNGAGMVQVRVGNDSSDTNIEAYQVCTCIVHFNFVRF